MKRYVFRKPYPHALVSKRAARRWVASKAVTGTTYTQTLAGAITSTGAITKNTFKAFGGSSTPSGSLTERIVFVLAVAGAITASGAIYKKIGKGVAGAVTVAGTLAKKTEKQVAGALTASGALARKTAKQLAGSLGPSGALGTVYRTAKAVAGSITAAGTLNGVKIVLTAAARKTRRLLMSFVNRR